SHLQLNRHRYSMILRRLSILMSAILTVYSWNWHRTRLVMLSAGEIALRLFRRVTGQPDRLPARHRIRWTILRIPSTGSAATTTRLHRSSSHLSPGRTLIARGSLAILIRDRLPRLNLHIESTQRMAVGTPPKRPCRNN